MDPQRETDFLAGKNYGEKAMALWDRWLNFRGQLYIGVPKGLEEKYLKTLEHIRKDCREVLSLLNEYDLESGRMELQELEKQMIQEERELREQAS